MAYRSRLSTRAERQLRRTFIVSIVGIAAVLFVFFKLIFPFLLNASTFFSTGKNEPIKKQNSENFVAPPLLNQTYDATNSAKISISGTALPKETVKLYVNNEGISSDQTKDDGTFLFDGIRLQQGRNTISAKAVNDKDKESDFSNELSVSYSNKQPTLTIDSPSENQSFSKDQNSINITGKTNQGNRVTVKGFWAIVNDSGTYSYTLSLSNGDNQIEVVSTDFAGNQTKLIRKVTYSP